MLFQRTVGLENRPIPISGTRILIGDAFARTGLTGGNGKPLDFAPHDFRRIFTTYAIMNGTPPHIAQILLGHKDINTTMGMRAAHPRPGPAGRRPRGTIRRRVRRAA